MFVKASVKVMSTVPAYCSSTADDTLCTGSTGNRQFVMSRYTLLKVKPKVLLRSKFKRIPYKFVGEHENQVS